MSAMRKPPKKFINSQQKKKRGRPPIVRDADGNVLPPAWRAKFIAALREEPNIGQACRIAGVTRRGASRAYERTASFRAQWNNAVKDAEDNGSNRMWTFGTVGVPYPVQLLVRERVRIEHVTVKRPDGTLKTDPVTVREKEYQTVVNYVPSIQALDRALRYHVKGWRDAQRANDPSVQAATVNVAAVAAKVEVNPERLPDAELERIVAQAVARGALPASTVEVLEASSVAANGNNGDSGSEG